MILKTYLLLIFLSLMYLPVYGQKRIKVKKLTENNDRLYLKNKPLNGYYRIKYYSSRRRTEVSNFIDGKREGSANCLIYGDLEKTTNYKNGKKEGEEINYYWYYTSGGIEKFSNYKNDLLDGWQFTYFHSKQLESKSLYANGELKQSINYFSDGNIQKECSFNNGDGFCIQFQTENSKNSDYKIIDSLFYKDESILNMKTYVNGILDSEIKVKYEKDTIEGYCSDVLTISFYKLKTFKEAYIFSGLNSKNELIDLIINSYKSICLTNTNEIMNYYIAPNKIVTEGGYMMADHFYVKNEKSIYEVDFIIELDDVSYSHH